MTLTRRHGGLVILFTFIVALLLTIAPLPEGLRPFRPDWVGLVLIYWCLALPDRVGVGYGWSAGLLLDVLTGTLLGQHALAFTLIAFLTLKLHQRVRLYPLWQQSLTVLLLLMLHQLINMWVQGITGRPPQDWSYWLPSLIGMVLWPFVYQTLRGLRRQFSVS
jgi:rod shape-determining protein MreD